LPRTRVSPSTVTLDKLRGIFQTYVRVCARALPNRAVNSRLIQPKPTTVRVEISRDDARLAHKVTRFKSWPKEARRSVKLFYC